eukprot:10903956-Ditylum_brightwellii.AAC.1
MAITAELITANFLHPVIGRLLGYPTYKCIYEVNKILSENAGSVQSTLGGRAHNLLGLTIRQADYTWETGHTFIPPNNPPLNPVFPPGFLTDQQHHKIIQHHDLDKELWQIYSVMDNAL